MSGGVGEGDRFRPSCETVYHCEEVSVARGWMGAHQIDVDMVKATTGDLKCLKWSPDVSMDLASLARDASLSPEAHLLADAMPDELGGDELSSCMHRWVGQAVDQITHLASPACGNDRPGMACGDVTEECDASWTERNILKFETGDGSAIRMYPRILFLAGGHGSVVDALVEGTDGSSGQCICDVVVLALNVSVVNSEMYARCRC